MKYKNQLIAALSFFTLLCGQVSMAADKSEPDAEIIKLKKTHDKLVAGEAAGMLTMAAGPIYVGLIDQGKSYQIIKSQKPAGLEEAYKTVRREKSLQELYPGRAISAEWDKAETQILKAKFKQAPLKAKIGLVAPIVTTVGALYGTIITDAMRDHIDTELWQKGYPYPETISTRTDKALAESKPSGEVNRSPAVQENAAAALK